MLLPGQSQVKMTIVRRAKLRVITWGVSRCVMEALRPGEAPMRRALVTARGGDMPIKPFPKDPEVCDPRVADWCDDQDRFDDRGEDQVEFDLEEEETS